MICQCLFSDDVVGGALSSNKGPFPTRVHVGELDPSLRNLPFFSVNCEQGGH